MSCYLMVFLYAFGMYSLGDAQWSAGLGLTLVLVPVVGGVLLVLTAVQPLVAKRLTGPAVFFVNLPLDLIIIIVSLSGALLFSQTLVEIIIA